jgi:hypothetical protein
VIAMPAALLMKTRLCSQVCISCPISWLIPADFR